MPANWAYIITYILVFGFAVYVGFLIGQEVCRRWVVTTRGYWTANIGGLVGIVLGVALIPAMMIQIILMGVLAGYIAGLKMSFGESSGPWKWLDNFMDVNHRHRKVAEKGTGEAYRRRRKSGEAGPDLISVDEKGSAGVPSKGAGRNDR